MVSFDIVKVGDVWSNELEYKHIVISLLDISLLIILESFLFFSYVVDFLHYLVHILGVCNLGADVFEFYWKVFIFPFLVDVRVVVLFELGVSIKVRVPPKTDFGLECPIDQSSLFLSHHNWVLINLLPGNSLFGVDCQASIKEISGIC